MSRTLLPALTLWRREIVRFLRQPNRVTAAVLQPALFWVLFGAGFEGSFRLEAPQGGPDQDFLEYFFPGTVVLILLFTAIFSTISIIEDRRAGFLQSVLAAPVSPAGIVLGKILGGATLALLQGLSFLSLVGVAGVPWTVASLLASAGVLALVAFALTSLGVLIAWPMDSTQGFHAIMMLVLMPMWLLSGAFFPLTGGPGWLRALMHANPLTYGVAAFRHTLYGGELSGQGLPSLYVSMAVTVLFGAVTFAAALRLVARRSRGAP